MLKIAVVVAYRAVSTTKAFPKCQVPAISGVRVGCGGNHIRRGREEDSTTEFSE
jgi:hypothetical protein